MLQGVGSGFFKAAINTSYTVGSDPVQSIVGNFDGQPDLVTVNAGSNDLTLTSNFEGPDPSTTTISSGGLDPDAAFAFESSSGFDDLVVGNSGDGVLALFEGGQDGLSLMSTQVEPDLPSPTALAFSALTGGQIQFYAATAGREAVDLVSLNLAVDTSFAVALPAPSSTVAQLVPFEGSSLPLVAVVLTLTVEVSANELSLAPARPRTVAPALPGWQWNHGRPEPDVRRAGGRFRRAGGCRRARGRWCGCGCGSCGGVAMGTVRAGVGPSIGTVPE